jgi:hypothetical protein
MDSQDDEEMEAATLLYEYSESDAFNEDGHDLIVKAGNSAEDLNDSVLGLPKSTDRQFGEPLSESAFKSLTESR